MRDSATCEGSQVAAGIGWGTRYQLGRAGVELATAEMAAQHVVACPSSHRVQLYISGGIEIWGRVVPLLTIFANGAYSKSIIRGWRPGLGGRGTNVATIVPLPAWI